MRYLFIIIILLISNQSFAEWKHLKGSDDKKIFKRTYIDKVKAVIDGKTKTINYKMITEQKSWHITKNYKKNKNCEPFTVSTVYHKKDIIYLMYGMDECTPCIDKKGMCGRPSLIAGFYTMKDILYNQKSEKKSMYDWIEDLKKNNVKLLKSDEYGSVHIDLIIPFGSRESLYIFTSKVEMNDRIQPYYTSRVVKYNTKNRKIISKAYNETRILDERVISQIDMLIAKIHGALKNPNTIEIDEEGLKTIFDSNILANFTRWQTRD